jgi:hypothetical protein
LARLGFAIAALLKLGITVRFPVVKLIVPTFVVCPAVIVKLNEPIVPEVPATVAVYVPGNRYCRNVPFVCVCHCWQAPEIEITGLASAVPFTSIVPLTRPVAELISMFAVLVFPPVANTEVEPNVMLGEQLFPYNVTVYDPGESPVRL